MLRYRYTVCLVLLVSTSQMELLYELLNFRSSTVKGFVLLECGAASLGN